MQCSIGGRQSLQIGYETDMRDITQEIIQQNHKTPVSDEQSELLSVIVPIYNIAPYMERGVSSLCNQTYRNLEIILVDDGSTDESGTRCDDFAKKDARVKVIHRPNGGLSAARNTGFAAATGALIAFMDGDDFVDPEMYARMISAMTFADAQAAVCRYKRVYRDHTEDISTDRVVLLEGMETLQVFLEERKEFDIQNAAWNKLYRREVIDDLRFPEGKKYEDIVYTTKALSRPKRCVYLDRAYYNYIIDREGSIMNAANPADILADQIPAYQEKTKFLESLGQDVLTDTHRYFFYKRLLLFYNDIRKAHRKDWKEYRLQMTDVIRKEAGADPNVRAKAYACPVANPNEQKKMSLFLRSPNLYWIFMRMNETFVLPIKERRKKC